MAKPKDTDEYIASFPADIQPLLELMRATIKEAAPDAEEVISYSLPAYKYNGMLAWFGAHTHHVGFYPRASGIAAFKQELSMYKNAKGSVQFPFDQPLPVELIKRIIAFRLEENLQRKKA